MVLGWQQALWLLVILRIGWGIVAFASVHLQPITLENGDWLNLVIRGGEPWSQLLSTWQRFDALWYQEIAEHGYRAGNGTATFYPLFPLLSRAVAVPLQGWLVLAELLVASAGFVAAVWLLYRVASLDVPNRTALLAVLLTVCFPTAFFLLAPYTESLFLLTTLAAFWFARTGRPWLAGLAGLAASLTRLQGAFLVAPLAFIYLQRCDAEKRRPGAALLASILPGLGVIAFTAYTHLVVHETLSTLGIQSFWGYQVVPPWQAIGASLRYIVDPGDPTQQPIELLNLAALLGFTALAVPAARRLSLGYALYTWPYLALLYTREMGYTPLMSVSRYTLVLFPCFIMLAVVLERRPWLAGGWLAVGLLLQALLLEVWVHFGFVA